MWHELAVDSDTQVPAGIALRSNSNHYNSVLARATCSVIMLFDYGHYGAWLTSMVRETIPFRSRSLYPLLQTLTVLPDAEGRHL
jgi:hypothetical protein